MPGNRRLVGLAAFSVLVGLAARAADEPSLVLEAERSSAGALSFSPDGRRLVSGGHYNDDSHIWDLDSGKPAATIQGCGNLVTTAAYAPNGRFVATAGLDTDHSRWVIALWDGRTGRRLGQLPENSGWAAAISPDGKTLAVARLGKRLGFFSLPDLQPIGEVEVALPDTPKLLAYSPDGSTLAAWVERSVWIGDARTGQQRRVVQVDFPVYSAAFARGGRLLVLGGMDGTVACWDVVAGAPAWSKPSHDGKEVRGVAVAPDGSLAASGAQDGTVRLWDVQSGDEVRTLDAELGAVQAVAFSRDGTKLAVGQGNAIAVWPIAQAKRAATRGGPRAKAAPRPKATQKFGRHSYALVNEPVTWHIAKGRCEAMGGHLATFETPAERDFLLKLIRAADTSAWVGASDEEEEGRWVWVTGQPVAKALQEGWTLDNHEGSQHALCYWKDHGAFDDGDAGCRIPFVCEWDD